MIKLTREQQASVLRRFSQEVDSSRPSSPYQRACKHTCRMCSNFSLTTNSMSWRLTPVWYLFEHYPEWPEWAKEHYETITRLYEHLSTEHEVSPCEVCNDMITRRGMTRHKKAPDCQAEQRRFQMRNKGYELLFAGDSSLIGNVVNTRLKRLESLAPWDDENLLAHLEAAANSAEYELLTSLGIRPCFTNWDPKAKTYIKENWAEPLSAQLLGYLNKLPENEEHDSVVLETIQQWIQGDNTTRESILAILELKNEGAF